MKTNRTRMLALAAGALLIGILTAGVGVWAMGLPKRKIEAQLVVGLTKEEVRERFGEPDRRYEAATAPWNY